MLLIRCPYCEEERPELEFRHAGEAHIARPTDIAEISDEAFEAYFFLRDNPKGILYERWRHIHGCARFFNAVRDTLSDKFLMTYKAGEPKPDLVEAANQDRHAAWANVPEPERLADEPSASAESDEQNGSKA